MGEKVENIRKSENPELSIHLNRFNINKRAFGSEKKLNSGKYLKTCKHATIKTNSG
jgi:hypothetical protein